MHFLKLGNYSPEGAKQTCLLRFSRNIGNLAHTPCKKPGVTVKQEQGEEEEGEEVEL